MKGRRMREKRKQEGSKTMANCLSNLKLTVASFFFFIRHTPSQADVAVFDACKAPSDASKYPHVARWFTHIASYEAEHPNLVGDKSKAATLLA